MGAAANSPATSFDEPAPVVGGASSRPAIMVDVAKVAGVSIQTVSRVLNASPSVRDSTRERVLEAIDQLGYRPNAIARALVNRRSAAIGVVAMDTRNHGPITTLLAIERAARVAGYGLVVVTPDTPRAAGFEEAYQRLLSASVAGMLLIAPQDLDSPALPPPGLLTVAVEAASIPDVPTARIEQQQGVRAAVRHLAALGHRRIDHIPGPAHWPEARLRLAGWREALDELALAEPPVQDGDWTSEVGYRWALRHARDPRVTAVVSANDQVALGVLRGCWEVGVRVPRQLSVIGFDDIPEAAWSIPGLTTVRQDFDSLGTAAVAMLLRVIAEADGRAGQRPQVVQPSLPRLVVRGSTAAPAA